MHEHCEKPIAIGQPAEPERLAARGARGWAVLAALAAMLAAPAAFGQNFPVTSGQRSTAEQVAQAGVPLSELAADAPDQYTIKRGDTLWAISGMFLARAWRWPELWGMNMADVRNPHRIYPGQTLVLEKRDGRATLRLAQSEGGPPTDIVRVSPRTRVELLADASISTLNLQLIEAFLAEPVIIDEAELLQAPRIVAAPENRVLITRGDRAYARGLTPTPLKMREEGRPDQYRVFRNARPLTDPLTNVVLGYEAQYLGKASLVRSESVQPVASPRGGEEPMIVPATIDIVSAKEEMRVGDRSAARTAPAVSQLCAARPRSRLGRNHRFDLWRCRGKCRAKPGGRNQPRHRGRIGDGPRDVHPEGRRAAGSTGHSRANAARRSSCRTSATGC